MTRTHLLCRVVFYFVLLVMLSKVLGCASAVPGLYGTELNACVDNAQTELQSQRCRCEVNKRYGRPCNPEVP